MAKVVFVVPCGRRKLRHAAPARLLYTGSMFQFGLSVIMEEADLASVVGHHAVVRILSAKHGLLDPESVVEPYDLAVTDRGGVPAAVMAAQVATLGAAQRLEVHAFLPRAYLTRLRAACGLVEQRGDAISIHDHYQTTRGIGDQKHVLTRLRRSRSSGEIRLCWRQTAFNDPETICAGRAARQGDCEC